MNRSEKSQKSQRTSEKNIAGRNKPESKSEGRNAGKSTEGKYAGKSTEGRNAGKSTDGRAGTDKTVTGRKTSTYSKKYGKK